MGQVKSEEGQPKARYAPRVFVKQLSARVQKELSAAAKEAEEAEADDLSADTSSRDAGQRFSQAYQSLGGLSPSSGGSHAGSGGAEPASDRCRHILIKAINTLASLSSHKTALDSLKDDVLAADNLQSMKKKMRDWYKQYRCPCCLFASQIGYYGYAVLGIRALLKTLDNCTALPLGSSFAAVESPNASWRNECTEFEGGESFCAKRS